MYDKDLVPAVIAGVGGIGVIAFIVGSAGLAAEYGGVWAAVTVGAFLVATVAAILLYAFGQMENETRGRQERY